MGNEAWIIGLLLILILGIWPYTRSWAYGATGILGLILAVCFLWFFMKSNGTGPKNTGAAVKEEVKDAGDELKDFGQDVKRSLKNVTR